MERRITITHGVGTETIMTIGIGEERIIIWEWET